jgi:hypothetical protein
MAGEPYAANGHSRYETEFRNESGHNSNNLVVKTSYSVCIIPIQGFLILG